MGVLFLLVSVGKYSKKKEKGQNKISKLKNPLHRGHRERTEFYYWIRINPEGDAHDRLSTRRLYRQQEILCTTEKSFTTHPLAVCR